MHRKPRKKSLVHPYDNLVRKDRLPHIWCPGCGIGTAFSAMLSAVKESALPLDDFAVVSGIGCTGRVAGYLKLDSFHTTHGRALPFATGLKLGNPRLNVVVFSGDGDLFAIGGNHFIHGARRNIDLAVFCVNNFNYGMTGGQVAPTTPYGAKTTTTPIGSDEFPFNLPLLAYAAGAVYVARWTTLHVRRLTEAVQEVLNRRGFRFIEILAPCPTAYGRRNKMREPLDALKFYEENTFVHHDADPANAEITMNGPIVIGKFVDRERPTFLDLWSKRHALAEEDQEDAA